MRERLIIFLTLEKILRQQPVGGETRFARFDQRLGFAEVRHRVIQQQHSAQGGFFFGDSLGKRRRGQGLDMQGHQRRGVTLAIERFDAGRPKLPAHVHDEIRKLHV